MKSAYIFILFIILLTACNQKEQFTIEGNVPSDWKTENVQLKLLDENLNDSNLIASSVIRKGKFKIKGIASHPDYVILRFSNNKFVYLFLENSTINIDIPTKTGNPSIKGSTSNNLLTEFNNQFSPYRVQLQQVRDDIIKARNQQNDNLEFLTQKRATMDTIIQNMVLCQKEFIVKNPNTLVTAYILRMSKTDLEIPYVRSVYYNLDNNIKYSSIGRSLKKQIDADEKTSLGKSFINIQLLNIDGELVAISKLLKNQEYILLDFWASWCGPCRHENDNILNIYKRYNKKGLQIVGISLDVKKEDWQRAIEEDHITWEQLSDLKGWNSPLIASYGIEGIPYTVLLDKDGKIIAKGLRAKNLMNRLQQIFSK